MVMFLWRLSEKEQELAALKTSFEEKQRQLTALVEQDLESEVFKERSRSADLETKLEESRIRQETLERNVAMLEESVSANGKLQQEFIEAEEMVNTVKSQLEAEVEKSKELTAQVDREYLRSVELEGDLQLTRLKLEDAHMELATAVSKNDELAELVSTTNEELANTRAQLEEECRKSERTENELGRIRSRSAELEADSEQNRKRTEDLVETVSTLERDRDRLKEQLSQSMAAETELNQQVLYLFICLIELTIHVPVVRKEEKNKKMLQSVVLRTAHIIQNNRSNMQIDKTQQ